MEYRPLDVTIISAESLKNVNLLSTMDVYVVVSIPGSKRKTNVDRNGGTSPTWNHRLKFTIEEAAIATQNLRFLIKSERALGDRDVGHVSVPLRELLHSNDGAAAAERIVEYQVRTSSGKPKGTLKFSFKFGDKITIPATSVNKAKTGDEPVMAYPPTAGASAAAYPAYPPPGVGYGMPPPQNMAAPYPPQPGYGYPPPAAAGGYGYPPPPTGYGYPPPGYGYPPQQGYGYPPVQQPKKKKGNKLGLGLGAGLLGGLLVGDMLSDVGDMGAYDAGYDAGFGDGGDFDF